ncbi:hypothetical protein MIND_01362100 [Mycena indigotica]|uniref:Transmembrane protein n=1 Tax=Mycena indigotica TaxID=2126181 RepID=A0A8H6VQ18_9AGAR|nr:uncharacterized protein MIND_01362100 [Mycena indigotica]KAF7289877.1 hypothetical protein MIND_01362100 [Mycena indigotica]
MADVAVSIPPCHTVQDSPPVPLTKLQRQEELLQRRSMPSHWRAPSNPVLKVCFQALSLIAFGQVGLEPIWATIKLEEEGDESIWEEGIRITCDRLNNMLLVASLLLATSAVFITTTPPRLNIVNYTLRGPYILMLGAFGLLIGGIIVASVAVLTTAKARPYWSEQVLYATRTNVWCTLIVLSYPFFAIGLAAIFLAFGILTAIWSVEDSGLQAAAPLLLFFPLLVALLFVYVNATAKARSRLRKNSQETAERMLP